MAFLNRQLNLGILDDRERRGQINLYGEPPMQIVTPQANHQAGLTLSLVIGVTGSPQALSRLKAKLELAVEDALQDISQQASYELGIEIGRCNIVASISQPERDGSASSMLPQGDSTEHLLAPSGYLSSAPLKAEPCL